jgi:hypothetical protein
LDAKEYGLVNPTVPVNVTERVPAVVLESVQNIPASLEVNVGTVNALNPLLVIRYTVDTLLDAKAREVPVTLEVIQRHSVGRVNRTLQVADKTRFILASLVTLPAAPLELVTLKELVLFTANPDASMFVIAL